MARCFVGFATDDLWGNCELMEPQAASELHGEAAAGRFSFVQVKGSIEFVCLPRKNARDFGRQTTDRFAFGIDHEPFAVLR